MILGGFLVIFSVPVVKGAATYFLAVFIFFLLWVCLASIVSIANSYNERADTLRGLALTYVDTILLFGAAYFLVSVFDVNDVLIKGIEPICIKMECEVDNTARFGSALIAFSESVYFSVVQSTGIDDSGIEVAGGLAQVVSASHGLAIFFITVLGVPKYFSSTTEKNIERAISELKEDIKITTPSQQKDSLFKKFVKFFA